MTRANEYCQRNNIALATLATKMMNDGKFFKRLNAGGTLTIDSYEKCMRFLNLPHGEGEEARKGD